jgi:hypothetical protein
MENWNGSSVAYAVAGRRSSSRSIDRIASFGAGIARPWCTGKMSPRRRTMRARRFGIIMLKFENDGEQRYEAH